LIALSLFETIDELEVRLGPQMSKWELQNLQTITLEHQPFTGVPILNRLFDQHSPA
jgi:hypothetical protein